MLFAHKDRVLSVEIVQNVEGRKKSQKCKKTFKKVLTNGFVGGIICKLSARECFAQAQNSAHKYERFADRQMTIV